MSIFSPFTLIKNLFTKPMTLQFPYESLEPVEGYRGRQLLDLEKCIGCGTCKRVCPNNAIDIVEFKGKKYPQIHLGKCCYCGLCAEYCPKGALKMTSAAMISVMDKSSVVYNPEKLSKPEK